ncbi:MAG: hypothetical protein JWQ66_3397 [Mucilaginibacter sp.]|nr:hypothetical protein [Mucilaginibacter sp.]
MMIRKMFMIALMLLYLYTLTFIIYLNAYFQIPTIIFGVALVCLFFDRKASWLFGWEFMFLIGANVLYYGIGLSDFKTVFINLSVIVTCGLYFNYFIGTNHKRFIASLLIFLGWLSLSIAVMFADRAYPQIVDKYRAILIGGDIVQSPSGICTTIFTFGYQLAAIVTFVFVYVLLKKRNSFIPVLVFAACIIPVFYGMQRSVLIGFITAGFIALVALYKSRSIPIIFGVGLLAAVFFTQVYNLNDDTNRDIFTKNAQNNENGEDRSGLVTEDLKIYSSYPFGLVFYNLQWNEVSRNTPAFAGGLTSHNAYLMFFTYLGPILSGLLLIGIYYSIAKIFRRALLNPQDKDNIILLGVCFAFLAISMNSLFHNAWLVNANGPTLFLYFSVLYLGKMKAAKDEALLKATLKPKLVAVK